MLVIPTTTTQAAYVAATTFTGQSKFSSGWLIVTTNSVFVQFFVQPDGSGFNPQPLQEVTVPAGTTWNFVEGTIPLAGLRVRDAVAGSHGKVTGLLSEPSDPQVFISP